MSLSLSVYVRVCVCVGVCGVSSRSVTSSGGQVKSLSVIENDVDELSVTVDDVSGVSCSNATLTTLPNGQLGMIDHTHTHTHTRSLSLSICTSGPKLTDIV